MDHIEEPYIKSTDYYKVRIYWCHHDFMSYQQTCVIIGQNYLTTDRVMELIFEMPLAEIVLIFMTS